MYVYMYMNMYMYMHMYIYMYMYMLIAYGTEFPMKKPAIWYATCHSLKKIDFHVHVHVHVHVRVHLHVHVHIHVHVNSLWHWIPHEKTCNLICHMP